MHSPMAMNNGGGASTAAFPHSRCTKQSPASFHNSAQQRYTKQVQHMLVQTPEYQRFAMLKDQTDLLRLMWWCGAICMVIICYFDLIMWATSNLKGSQYWGAAFSVLPPQFALAGTLLALSYAAGFLFLAPWVGLNGDVQDVNIGRVVAAHIMAAGVFSWLPVRPLGVYLPATMSLDVLPQGFVPALAPLVTGSVLRYVLFERSWRSRIVLPAPLLWLPPLHTLATMTLWYILATAAASTNPMTPQYYLAAVPKAAVTVIHNCATLRPTAAEAAQFLLPTWIAAQMFVGLLLAMLIEALVAGQFRLGKLIKSLLFPDSPRMMAIYILGCAAMLYRFFEPVHELRPYWYYVLALYTVTLFLRGIPDAEDE